MVFSLRTDFDARSLAAQAETHKDPLARRMKAIAKLYENGDVATVAQSENVEAGTLRRWAYAFNEDGIDGLHNVTAGGSVELRSDYDAEAIRKAASGIEHGGYRAQLAAVASLFDGMDVKTAARMHGATTEQITDWRRQFNDQGVLLPAERRSRPRLDDIKANRWNYDADSIKAIAASAADPEVAKRLDVIVSSYEGEKPAAIADRMGVDRASVTSWIKAFNAGGPAALGADVEDREPIIVGSQIKLPPGYSPELLRRLAEETVDFIQRNKILGIAFLYEGLSYEAAAKKHGSSEGQLSSWMRHFKAGGIEALATTAKKTGPNFRDDIDEQGIRERADSYMDRDQADRLVAIAEVYGGRRASDVAEDIGKSAGLVSRWVSDFYANGFGAFPDVIDRLGEKVEKQRQVWRRDRKKIGFAVARVDDARRLPGDDTKPPEPQAVLGLPAPAVPRPVIAKDDRLVYDLTGHTKDELVARSRDADGRHRDAILALTRLSPIMTLERIASEYKLRVQELRDTAWWLKTGTAAVSTADTSAPLPVASPAQATFKAGTYEGSTFLYGWMSPSISSFHRKRLELIASISESVPLEAVATKEGMSPTVLAHWIKRIENAGPESLESPTQSLFLTRDFSTAVIRGRAKHTSKAVAMPRAEAICVFYDTGSVEKALKGGVTLDDLKRLVRDFNEGEQGYVFDAPAKKPAKAKPTKPTPVKAPTSATVPASSRMPPAAPRPVVAAPVSARPYAPVFEKVTGLSLRASAERATPEDRVRLIALAALADGNSLDSAASAANVSPKMVQSWVRQLERGLTFSEAPEPIKATPPIVPLVAKPVVIPKKAPAVKPTAPVVQAAGQAVPSRLVSPAPASLRTPKAMPPRPPVPTAKPAAQPAASSGWAMRGDYSASKLAQMIKSAQKPATLKKLTVIEMAYRSEPAATISFLLGIANPKVEAYVEAFNKKGLAGLMAA
jgi:transposase